MSGNDGWGPGMDRYEQQRDRDMARRYAEALRVISEAGGDACLVKRKGQFVGLSTFARSVLEWDGLLPTQREGKEAP